jgi:hypothetical protein
MAMNRLAKFPIAKFYQGRNVYYSKEDVEKYFANLLVNFSLTIFLLSIKLTI